MSQTRHLTQSREAIEGTNLLDLAAQDADRARHMINALSATQQLEACLHVAAHHRHLLLDLLDNPEGVIPRIPEVEFVGTVRGAGVRDSGWILAHSTPEQRIACIDIDCWQRSQPELRRFRDWIDALILSGGDTLLQSLREFDPEFWILALRDMARIRIAEPTNEPYGFYTEDGVVFYQPRQVGDRERLHHLLATLMSEDPALYWQLTRGSIYEDPFETEEFASRWRSGRMADLGFPELEQAMQAYRPLSVEHITTLEYRHSAHTPALPLERVELPVAVRGSLVARTLRAIDRERAADILGNVLAVANTLAVADRLELSDSRTIPKSLRKAIRGIDRGLRELAHREARSPEQLLLSHAPLDLFRVGMTLDKGMRFELPPEEELYEELLDLIGIQPEDDPILQEAEEAEAAEEG